MNILIPLPARDFDPTEAAVAWRLLVAAGHDIVFATPTGQPAKADRRMLTGKGLGPWKTLLRARSDAREAYAAMVRTPEFCSPLRYADLSPEGRDLNGLLLPGGHDQGMRGLLEAPELQDMVAAWMKANRPLAAICHGVVVVARSIDPETNKSVLFGRRTTALLQSQELTAWWLTRAWLGNYYRTYPQTVEQEVTAALASSGDFVNGPLAVRRDTPARPGFYVRDANYISARWPGDVYGFVAAFIDVLAEYSK